MSDWTVHLEFEEGTSSKFWRARVEGKTLYVNYGKIGQAGQTQVKQLGDPDAAEAEYEKLIREKRKKGYVDAGGEGGGGDEGEDDGDEGGDDDDDEEEAPAPKKPAPKPAAVAAAPTARPTGVRYVLEAGKRKVETYLSIDGKTVRMEAVETYADPEAAKKAHERLKKTLLGEGYKQG
jgi:predicted DNA-binding WGR domain protein